jgi:hypothetical protein
VGRQRGPRSNRFDTNRDGRLTRAELGSVRPPTPFASIDTNRDWPHLDGRVAVVAPHVHPAGRNSDGVLTREEYRGGPEER